MVTPFRSPLSLGNALSGNFGSNALGLGHLLEDSIRRRESWNARFEHWEKRESDSETTRIERAREMVRDALQGNAWLTGQGTMLLPQGSYTNRTNTRGESDIDLRVQNPSRFMQYMNGVDPALALRVGGYFNSGFTYAELNNAMRTEIAKELRGAFGRGAVDDTGSKAIRVNGVDGSRAEVDVVPGFTLHVIGEVTLRGNNGYEGFAILSKDNGSWTFNYPDQHIANNLAKWKATSQRFRKVVRTVKRLQADMEEHGMLDDRVPSFLIECLVWQIEDSHFLVETDDRYGRVRRVLGQVSQRLNASLPFLYMTEINGIKPLFGAGQSWTLEIAQSFVARAIKHLGNA